MVMVCACVFKASLAIGLGQQQTAPKRLRSSQLHQANNPFTFQPMAPPHDALVHRPVVRQQRQPSTVIRQQRQQKEGYQYNQPSPAFFLPSSPGNAPPTSRHTFNFALASRRSWCGGFHRRHRISRSMARRRNFQKQQRRALLPPPPPPPSCHLNLSGFEWWCWSLDLPVAVDFLTHQAKPSKESKRRSSMEFIKSIPIFIRWKLSKP